MNTAYRTHDCAVTCKRCGGPLGSLRDRLFGTDGELRCLTCFQDERQEEHDREKRKNDRRETLAMIVALGGWGAAAAVACFGRAGLTSLAVAGGILAIAHVASEAISPRVFRWFTL